MSSQWPPLGAPHTRSRLRRKAVENCSPTVQNMNGHSLVARPRPPRLSGRLWKRLRGRTVAKGGRFPSNRPSTWTSKEAGLGDEAQVHIVISATAECINPGSNHPKAATSRASRPRVTSVQNGKANFSPSVTATFHPDCTPPMTVVFVDITVSDTTNGNTLKLADLPPPRW